MKVRPIRRLASFKHLRAKHVLAIRVHAHACFRASAEAASIKDTLMRPTVAVVQVQMLPGCHALRCLQTSPLQSCRVLGLKWPARPYEVRQ